MSLKICASQGTEDVKTETKEAGMVERLAAVEAERLPDEIVKAIEALQIAAEQFGGQTFIVMGDGAKVNQSRFALDATILRHLSAVEAERDGLRESVQKMHRRCQTGEADLQGLVEHLRSGVDVWMKATRAAESERDAALSRAERLEKALEFYRSAAVTSVTMEGLHYQGVSNSMFRHAWEADRAALSSVAEEA